MGLNLSLTTHSIELVTTGTGAVHVVASFIDTLGATKTAGSQTAIITSATTTTIIAAPTGTITREISNINIEAVAGNTVTVQKDVATVDHVLIGPIPMTAGQRLEFTSSVGWRRTELGTIPDDTFLANISGATAQPTAVPLTTLAGAGLTGGADAILNVGAGTGITVNTNDVQISTIAADSFFMNATAGVAVPTAVAGTTVAGNALTYTTGGILAVVPGAGASLVVSANDIQRGALTGAVTATQDSNTTAFGTAAAKSVLANATNATAIPAYLAGSAAFQHLRVNSGNTGLEWALIGLADFPTIAAGSFLANITASTAVPTAVDLSTFAGAGLTYTNVTGILAVVAGAGASLVTSANDIQRGALTGAITASQDSNATAFGVLAAKSVLANATNASAVPAALAGSAAFQHLRVNSANTGLEWSVLTSGDFPAGTVPLTGLATQAAETFLGNFTAGVASPTALAGSTVAGGGLTYTTGGILAVGAGTGLTVNANDVQISSITAKSAFVNATNAAGVPAALAGAGALSYLRVNAANTALEFGTLPGGSAHVIRDDGVDMAAEAALNFTSTSTINAVLTDDAGNGETEVALSLIDATVTPIKLAVFGTPTNAGSLFTVYVSYAAGAGGAPDDVTIYSTTVPFNFRILEAWQVTLTAVAASTVQARTASGGLGTALTTAISSVVAGKTSDNSTATTTVASGGSIFLRRSDSGIAGEFFLLCTRT